MIIVSDALQAAHGTDHTRFILHSAIDLNVNTYRIDWFKAMPRNPLGWYAWLCGCPTAACLVPHIPLQADDRQCWLASPYYGQLQRDRFRIMLESELDWQAADAIAVCSLLNPMLAEEGMRLEAIGSLLLLLSPTILEASPLSLVQLDGDCLPNRPPQGKDALQLMRIMGDIQTQLYQTPWRHSVDHAPIIHGLWLHDSLRLPWVNSLSTASPLIDSPYHVLNASNNPAKQIQVTIKTANQCQLLNRWPKKIMLAGDGAVALLSQRRVWQRWLTPHHTAWLLRNPNEESVLRQHICQYDQ